MKVIMINSVLSCDVLVLIGVLLQLNIISATSNHVFLKSDPSSDRPARPNGPPQAAWSSLCSTFMSNVTDDLRLENKGKQPNRALHLCLFTKARHSVKQRTKKSVECLDCKDGEEEDSDKRGKRSSLSGYPWDLSL